MFDLGTFLQVPPLKQGAEAHGESERNKHPVIRIKPFMIFKSYFVIQTNESMDRKINLKGVHQETKSIHKLQRLCKKERESPFQ